MQQPLRSSLLFIAAAWMLAACSDTPAPRFVEGTAPRFEAAASLHPFNSDLVFSNAAGSDGTADLGAATDPVRAGVNALDGMSTSAYFDIAINGSVDPATAVAGTSVHVVRLDTGSGDALDLASITGIAGTAPFDVRVVSLDGGTHNTIRVRPTRPLESRSKYLVVLTNDLRDAAGRPLTRSTNFNRLRDTQHALSASEVPLRPTVLQWETLGADHLAAGSAGALSPAAAREKIVLAYTFTTTDPTAVMHAMANPVATIAAMQIAAGETPSVAVTNASALATGGLLSNPQARPVGMSGLTGIDMSAFSSALAPYVGALYTGYIRLPYYQTAPAGLPFGAFLARNWQPDTALAAALGTHVPADVDGSFNVTHRYPFATKTSDETVPLQLTLPQSNWVPGYAGAANCGQIYAATGYPVVMYVHGITSDRTSVLALSHTLASRCIATVAIDLPLHGVPANSAFVNVLNVEYSTSIPFATLYGADAPHERHFNVAGPTGSPAPMDFSAPTSNDGSGAQFINLGHLANTRDNSRQAVMDLLNLNASLGALNTEILRFNPLGLDRNRLYLFGVSLGGILGNVFTTTNQISIANGAQVGLPSALSPIRGLVLASAGSQMAQIIATSPTFGPVIQNGLAANGVNVGTTHYERFLYTAQSLMDAADAVTFSKLLVPLGVPILLQQIRNDQVIVNASDNAPLAGTEALATLLDTTRLGLGSTQLGRGFVKLDAGGHTSLLRPEGGAPQVTAELQAQVVTFVLNNGNVAVGSAAPGNIDLSVP